MAVFLGPRQITASDRERKRKPRDMQRREPCFMALPPSVSVAVVVVSGCEVEEALGVVMMVEG